MTMPPADEFATSRSHQDAQITNEHARAAARSAILINGGAATAILAFISKEGTMARVLDIAAISLGLYATGVFFGAMTILALASTANHWNSYWEECAQKNPDPSRTIVSERKAVRWQRIGTGFFVIALACFLVASVAFATAVYRLR
jgi:hypothetical protein